MSLNYTAQDISGTTLAFLLFPLIFIFPGFVTSWFLNLFEFKKRSPLMQLGIAIIISFSICPILIFLSWRLISFEFTFGVIFVFLIIFAAIFVKTGLRHKHISLSKDSKIVLILAAGWIVLALISLVDMQIGNRLYYSIVSMDYTTRVAVTNAILRTGVPPINPSFYPGYPVKLTSLYYFWYILVSVIARIGTGLVNGRTSMIASAIWSGLGLMALISIYFRLRTPRNNQGPWRLAIIGISTLAIGGLDILPTLVLNITSQIVFGKIFFDGVVEHWNEEISTWLTSMLWVPHHIAGLIVCITILMLFQFAADRPRREKIAAMFVAGLGFASAFGLSVWVTLTFCTFWGFWFIYQLLFEKKSELAIFMLLSGIVALAAAYPFIADFLGGGMGTSGSQALFPLMLSVRRFNLALPITFSLSPVWQNLIHLAFLPINYVLELGYFFVIALIWLKQSRRQAIRSNPYQAAELILLAVTFLLASFVKSTIILNNDFGWRAWLFGQFVLLIWSTDIISDILSHRQITTLKMVPRAISQKSSLLAFFLMIGLITTISNILLLRTWPLAIDANLAMPYELSQDTHLGERTYAAKQAYRFLDAHVPLGAIIQPDPTIIYDRALGLYGNRQVVISNLTAYGVSANNIAMFTNQIEPIFQAKDVVSWVSINQICQQDHIDILVVNDLDPLWHNLNELAKVHPAFYQNSYYAVLGCGNFSASNLLKP
jgi:hypothetical protein